MIPFPLPVSAIGPGSQAGDEALDYLPMPSDMAVFRQPPTPESADPQALLQVRAFLTRLIAAMQAQPFGVPRFDLGGLQPAALELLNQTLGEGEVSVVVRAPRRLRIQETAFAGVWRVRELADDGAIAADAIEVCPIPAVVVASVQALGATRFAPPVPPADPSTELRTGLMNAPALLAEIADHAARWRSGQPPHIINLTLLPVSPQDLDHLAQALGAGPATILSRGYGNCRISSTRLANVWRVQYFNSMDRPILDTIEVVDVPEVALAAAEDHADSIERLGEWLEMLSLE
jgi:hydrogenase-1 operon protein HyaF